MSRDAPRPWRSIRVRVTLFTLAVFLVSLWALAFYSSQVLREDIERLLSEQQFSTASVLAKGVDDELASRLKDLETVAAAVSQSYPEHPSAVQQRLESLPIFQSRFNGGTFATRIDGTAIAEVPPATGRSGVNFRESDAVAAALDEGRPAIGRPRLATQLHAPVFHMAVPVRDAQGKVIGALVGVTNLAGANFLDRITESRFGKTGGYLLVAPQHRLVVTATDKKRIMEASPAPGSHPAIDRFLAGEEGTAIFVNPVGVEVLQSVKRVPVAGWYVAVALPSAEAFAPIRNMQQRMLQAALLLSLLAGGLTWWLLRHQLSPMLATLKTLTELADNHRHPQCLPVASDDEIGQLIGGFNRLLETLAQRDAELRRNSQHLKQILDNMFAYVALLDVNGVILEINKAPLARAGYTREEVIGKAFCDFPTWSYDKTVRARLIGAIDEARQGVACRLELVAKIGDTLLPSDSQISPVRNEHGEIIGLLATGVDISRRRQAEEQLRIAATAFEAHQGVVVTDSLGVIIKANRAFSDITGYMQDELIGQNMSVLRSAAHGADFYAQLWQELSSDGKWQGEIWNRHKNGEVHPYWLIVSAVKDDNGLVTNYVAAYTDIADRKRAEDALRITTERLNEAQRISHIGSWALDVPSGKLVWSHEIYRLFEIDEGHFDATSEAFLEAIHPEDREAVKQAYADALQNHAPHEITHRLLMSDGRIKWVHERWHLEFDAAGNALRSVGTVQDITEQKLTEDALSQAKRQMDSIVNNMPAMVFLKRASDLRYELFNRAGIIT